MHDVPFLRGRAELYRRMAGNTTNRNLVGEFLRLAVDCEEQAAAIEKVLPQERISIRRHPANLSRRQPYLRTA
jgi:hypothetical protein